MSHGAVGADVEELQRLAQQFDHAATRLQQLAGTVGNGIRISAWVGPFAVRFRHTWDSEHSVKLRQAADLLHRNAVLLRAEAQQQSIASNSNGNASIPRATMPGAGGTGGRGVGDVLGDTWKALGEGFTALGAMGGVAGIAAFLANSPVVGRYPKGWSVSKDFFRYKQSPVLRGIHNLMPNIFGGHLPGALSAVSKGFGRVNVVGSVLDVVNGGAAIGQNIASGNWAGATLSSLTTGADAAKASKAGYLYGVAAQAVLTAGDLASKSDFSTEGMSMVWNELTRDPWGSLKAGFDENVKVMPGQLVEIFT